MNKKEYDTIKESQQTLLNLTTAVMFKYYKDDIEKLGEHYMIDKITEIKEKPFIEATDTKGNTISVNGIEMEKTVWSLLDLIKEYENKI